MIYDDTRVLALTVSIRMKVQYRYDRRIEGFFLGSSENTFLF